MFKIEKSYCGNYVRVTLSNGSEQVLTMFEWSEALSKNEFFALSKSIKTQEA